MASVLKVLLCSCYGCNSDISRLCDLFSATKMSDLFFSQCLYTHCSGWLEKIVSSANVKISAGSAGNEAGDMVSWKAWPDSANQQSEELSVSSGVGVKHSGPRLFEFTKPADFFILCRSFNCAGFFTLWNQKTFLEQVFFCIYANSNCAGTTVLHAKRGKIGTFTARTKLKKTLSLHNGKKHKLKTSTYLKKSPAKNYFEFFWKHCVQTVSNLPPQTISPFGLHEICLLCTHKVRCGLDSALKLLKGVKEP